MSERPIEYGMNWHALGQKKFDQMVEALLQRKYSEAYNLEVWAPNGRGGDGGIDIAVFPRGTEPTNTGLEPGKSGHELIIYQLKFFPDGVSSVQKGQITRSFNRVKNRKPTEWVLVVPSNLTEKVRKDIRSLGKKNQIPVRYVDESQLIELLSKHKDLVDFYRRDEYLFERLRELREEQAGLTNGSQGLFTRLSGLQGVANSVDPDWAIGFSSGPTGRSITPIPKHARAHETSPIRFDFGLRQTPSGQLASRKLMELEHYGAANSVIIDSEDIDRFQYTGTELLRPFGEISRIILTSAPNTRNIENSAVSVGVMDQSGNETNTLRGVATHADRGTKGISLSFILARHLEISMLLAIPEASDEHVGHGEMQISHTVRGSLAHLALKSARALDSLTNANQLIVRIEDENLFKIAVTDIDSVEDALSRRVMIQAFDDMTTIGKWTSHPLIVPEELDANDRYYLRAMRLLLEGHRTFWPLRSLVGSAPADLSKKDEDILNQRRQRAVQYVDEDLIMEIGKNRIELGTMILWHPEATFEWVEQSERKFRAKVPAESAYVAVLERFLDTSSTQPVRWLLPDTEGPSLPNTKFKE